jgi:hypothetical protein
MDSRFTEAESLSLLLQGTYHFMDSFCVPAG